MKYRRATSDDMRSVAKLFVAAFPDSVRHTMGADAPPLDFLADLFRMCLDTDPEGFLVAEDDLGRLAGYVVAPLAVNRIWRRAVGGGYLWRWFRSALSGRLRVSLATIRTAVADKFAFWRSQKTAAEIPARILSIAVAPWAQGRGIGSELLARAIARFRRANVPRVRLEVRPWNRPAVRMYERSGFKEIGRTRDTQGEWLILVLEL